MKKILFTCIFVSILLYSLLFPEITISASQNGIQIWFERILPTLLPFTILSSVLINSKFLESCPGNGTIISIILTMICGFVFGFPIGAKLSADFYKNKLLTEKQATILSVTTNNFSPMYVCGFALPTLFGSDRYHIPTYFFLYLLPLLITTIYLVLTFSNQVGENQKNTASQFHLNMQVMDAGIISGFQSLIKICGYIVLFSIISQILRNLWIHPPFIWSLLLENLEITNGIHLLSTDNFLSSQIYIQAIQLLSFGGISGIAQTASIFSDSGLSVYKYIIGKVVLSLFLTLLTVIYVSCFIPLS